VKCIVRTELLRKGKQDVDVDLKHRQTQVRHAENDAVRNLESKYKRLINKCLRNWLKSFPHRVTYKELHNAALFGLWKGIKETDNLKALSKYIRYELSHYMRHAGVLGKEYVLVEVDSEYQQPEIVEARDTAYAASKILDKNVYEMLMAKFAGVKSKQIAEKHNVSEVHVNLKCFRAIRKLRGELCSW
jgi:DNA-directed RNA polymerase specialized sigma subunit